MATLEDTLRHWRGHRRWLAEQRLLETLNDATLRDIGLAERGARPSTLSLIDYERGRW